MGFLTKIFGGKTTNDKSNDLAKTAEMLDENVFWQIVQESLDTSNNQEDQEAFLIKRLQKLTPTEIIGFRLRTDKMLYDSYTSNMWCAGYIMNGGCSDDGFEYFRNWVISRGKKVYYDAQENPDTLVSNAPADMYAAMGAEDQRIYVIPSKNMVVVRMGDASDPANPSFALSGFDNALWQKIIAVID